MTKTGRSKASNPRLEKEQMEKGLVIPQEALAPPVEAYMERVNAVGLRKPPAFEPDPERDGALRLTPPSREDFLYQMGEATGTVHKDSIVTFIREVAAVVAPGHEDPASEMRAAVGRMMDIAPRDGLEGLLVAQMVAVHSAAMAELANSMRSGQDRDLRTARINRATRLMRLFVLQIDTLNKNRGKAPSEQWVTVEHVHVHEGGQAVVGNVTTPEKPKNGERGVG
jgi:hypothetical protein